MKLSITIFLNASIFLLLILSCKKNSFITSSNAVLSTSLYSDTIKFDTVFTSTGSITQSFKIFNNNNQPLLLSKVQLIGGNASSFKININGDPSSSVNNIAIAANDSIYVFVSVNINPTNQNLPFIVRDSILINYNGNNVYIQLQAFGQNAHFLTNKIVNTSTIWTNDLPYVLLGNLQVDSAVSLTIQPGCRIYAHNNAAFIVNGTLIVTGNKQQPVIFTGDRLDALYKNLPASWPGIFFNTSSANNVLTFANILNANKGIIVNGLASNANPKLIIHQCKIDNALNVGLLCNNGSVNMDNSLITNCGTILL